MNQEGSNVRQLLVRRCRGALEGGRRRWRWGRHRTRSQQEKCAMSVRGFRRLRSPREAPPPPEHSHIFRPRDQRHSEPQVAMRNGWFGMMLEFSWPDWLAFPTRRVAEKLAGGAARHERNHRTTFINLDAPRRWRERFSRPAGANPFVRRVPVVALVPRCTTG